MTIARPVNVVTVRGLFLGTFVTAQSTSEIYETTLPRAALAICCGAIVGALILALYLVREFFFADNFVAILPQVALAAFLKLLPFCFVGLVGFAVVPWWLLHRWNYRGWKSAVALGVGLAYLFPVIAFLIDAGGKIPADVPDWSYILAVFIRVGGIGGVVGLIIWRIAYRRVRHRLDGHL